MSKKKKNPRYYDDLYCVRSKSKKKKHMWLVFDFEFPNDYVGEDAFVMFHYDENTEQYVYDKARDQFDNFFEYVVDAYELEEVKDWYEYAKKCKEFEGSKDIPKSSR